MPPRPRSPLAVLSEPLSEREWLSSTEVLDRAQVTIKTLEAWRNAGLLPNSVHVARSRRWLYLRADVDRVLRSPHVTARGVDHQAVLGDIDGAPS